ncbi:TPA: hypothetical protein P0E37_000359 [Vibrio campbellii]|uniref:hypothetical protein n=1 Tax=Vibrio campbellii TaxID=680 RepID=UPI00142E82C1|nr:hypothetical protein [Vibrio campbellii]NIY86054.1 hypothetical protein [Vibrio campbellii]NVK68931.1 hypothetical protein [Vibrio campbellii]HDM8225924.1 hypothetical protein [Vibrio campbellii]HDM8238397.1 hypothetical protein [Vibrio campbellii]
MKTFMHGELAGTILTAHGNAVITVHALRGELLFDVTYNQGNPLSVVLPHGRKLDFSVSSNGSGVVFDLNESNGNFIVEYDTDADLTWSLAP